jgi:hypothetical protein
MQFPQVFRLRQRFAGPVESDIPGAVRRELAKLPLAERVRPGERVAITAGSRGIANIAIILREAVRFFRELGASPFLVPAMGSHGGANVEGQLEVLRTFGITAEFCECPILASMETVVVCQSPEGVDVHFDRHAFEADHVLVCGRIKAHTDFTGEIQSGLMKMMLIGLGKHRGASIYHRAFQDYSFDQIARSVSATVIDQCRILGALAILENGYEQTALLEAVPATQIGSREPQLLQLANQWLARLPFERIDVLVVDEIGKNVSGTGLDTNVVGRKINEHEAQENEWPKIKKIVVRSLTQETHGNATGIGIADFTTQRVIDQMDYAAMRVNCVTSGRTAVGMIPLHYPTDREAIQAALSTVGLVPPEKSRLVHIPNTLHLQQMDCSVAFWDEVLKRPELEVLSEPRDLQFLEDGSLHALH